MLFDGDVCVTQDVLPGSTVTHAKARNESLDDGAGTLIMKNRSAVHSLWRVAHAGLARPDCLLVESEHLDEPTWKR